MILDILFHPSFMELLFCWQACIWIYLWIDENSVVQFVGKIFIAGKPKSLIILALDPFELTFTWVLSVSPELMHAPAKYKSH